VFWFWFVCHLVALILSSPQNACRGERRGVWGGAAPIKPIHPPAGILVWSLIAKRAVRATLIVFDTPAFQDNARLLQIAEEFAVEAFIAKLVVEALNIDRSPKGFPA